MAKKHGSKSAAIREVLATHPKADLTTIKAELGKRKVKASDALINKLKYGKRSKGGRRSAGKNGRVDIGHLMAAKEMVGRVGGIEQAQAALDGLAKLIG